MLAGRAFLVAIAAMGLAAAGQAEAPVPQPPSESGAAKPPAGDGAGPAPQPRPAEQSPQPQPAQPAEGSAQKPASEGVRKAQLLSILGRDVTNKNGDGGRLIDVLVDLEGQSAAVVVEFGGFMGIGSRKVAVDWSALRFVRDGDRTALVLDISREQIRDAAEYKPNEPAAVLKTR